MTRKFPRFFLGLLGLITIYFPFSMLKARQDVLSVEAVFNFIDSQVVPIKATDGGFTDAYLALSTTYLEPNEAHGFRKLRGHIYTNALAVMVLTHRGLSADNPAHLQKAVGILQTFNHHQYPEDGQYPHLAGAFPNQLIAEDYHHDRGATQPYPIEHQARIVRHGNNAWYLMAMSYYTLRTGDRQFVPAVARLADYFSSDRAQVKQTDSPKHGAILFGWGNTGSGEPLNTRQAYVATNDQAVAYAGLIYAAEVMRTEKHGVDKCWRYLQAAQQILTFTARSLYSEKEESHPTYGKGGFFHTGTDNNGIPVAYNPSLDAQTYSYLAFAQPLQGLKNVADALDYAWEHMYGQQASAVHASGVDAVFGKTPTRKPVKGRGALWYQGDEGIWLTGSAQLALSFKYAHYLSGDRTDLYRSKTIFTDMSELVWLEDTFTNGGQSTHWPAGGFSSFSDNYYAHAEPESVGIAEKLPSLEPTAWRYFDMNHLNPYSVKLQEPLPTPSNFAIRTTTKGTLLSWEPHPLAVSYVVMRDDNPEPIAYVSNLGYTGSHLQFLDETDDRECVYSVIPRNLTGQEGERCVMGSAAHYAVNSPRSFNTPNVN